ncbi:MAG: response regulator [Candidatus Schekmanbacteria bacterium]|nr:response regulator [Candidatus Schekmanbacteria bacterium]
MFATRLQQERYDVILCDDTIPCYDGLSALTFVRERKPDVPFIFVSGTIGEDRLIETFKRGPTDYVLKDNLGRIGAVVRRALKKLPERRERKLAEEALRESEERYRALYESSIDAVMVTAPDGTVLSANPAACRMCGGTEEDLCLAGRGKLVDSADSHRGERRSGGCPCHRGESRRHRAGPVRRHHAGAEWWRCARRPGEASKAPIVFMSGYPADIIRAKGLVDETSEIVMKPAAPAVLLRKVREALDRV